MTKQTIVRKVFINKRNNQLSLTIPKKEIKKINPDIKFGEQLFVELSVVRRRKEK